MKIYKQTVITIFTIISLLLVINYKTTANAVETIKKTNNSTLLGFNYAVTGSSDMGIMLPEKISSDTVMIKVTVGNQSAYLTNTSRNYWQFKEYKNGIKGNLKVEYYENANCPYRVRSYEIDQSMVNDNGNLLSKYKNNYFKKICDRNQEYVYFTYFPIYSYKHYKWDLTKSDREVYGKGNYYMLNFTKEFKKSDDITISIEKQKGTMLESTILIKTKVMQEVKIPEPTIRNNTINVNAKNVQSIKATYDGKYIKTKKINSEKYLVLINKPMLNKKLKITIAYKDGLKEIIQEKTSSPYISYSYNKSVEPKKPFSINAKKVKATDVLKIKVGKKYYSAKFSAKGKVKIVLPVSTPIGKKYTFYIQDKYGNNFEKGFFYYYKYSKPKVGMEKAKVKRTLLYLKYGSADNITKYTSNKKVYEDWYYYIGDNYSKTYRISFIDEKVSAVKKY